jgi:aminomethyltransferase
MDNAAYDHLRGGGTGFYEQKRGLVAVWGGEAVQFLDGLITNDVKALVDGGQMLAAFPNAQGRLLAVVRVAQQAERFLIETEEATRQKVFENLHRFTLAGDFFVEDLSERYRYLTIFDRSFVPITPPFVEFETTGATDYFFENEDFGDIRAELTNFNAVEVPDDVYETIRIESGIPLYGVDMDETTIVPELGLDGLVSYNKGCYIGQEIIARIRFRGHVAKQLTGLILSELGSVASGFLPGAELESADSKNAGRITSVVFSPNLEQTIGLAFVRYDYLAPRTELKTGNASALVATLPFIQ